MRSHPGSKYMPTTTIFTGDRITRDRKKHTRYRKPPSTPNTRFPTKKRKGGREPAKSYKACSHRSPTKNKQKSNGYPPEREEKKKKKKRTRTGSSYIYTCAVRQHHRSQKKTGFSRGGGRVGGEKMNRAFTRPISTMVPTLTPMPQQHNSPTVL